MTTCAKSDGTQPGKACTVEKTCVTGLKCDTTTGLCALNSDGTKGSPCRTTGDCKTTVYPGLQCIAPTADGLGTCDCGSTSPILSKCTDDSICVAGTKPPDWDKNFPGPTDASRQNYTGQCSASQWYRDAKGKCSHQQGDSTPMLAGLQKDGNLGCIALGNWQAYTPSFQEAYTKFCTRF